MELPELIAYTPEEYVDKCVALANDIAHLRELREAMRGKMQASSLIDAAYFTRNLETLYQRMWEDWCTTGADHYLELPKAVFCE
jgi:predicted O-linked N-acetylglucosamine transferase (SPINDLY family)